MKTKSRLGWCAFGTLALVRSLVACTEDTPSPGDPSGGAPGSAGSPVGGMTSSGAAGMPLSGAAGSTAQGGMAGSAAGNSSGGQSVQAGAAGAGGTSNGGSAGGGGSSAGSAGSAGQGGGGTGGGASGPGAELNGESWTMKCNREDTAPDAENRCYLDPPNTTNCGSGYTSVDRTLHFGGTPGTTYQVKIRFQGTHEAGDYQGGTKQGAKGEFLTGATHTANGLHTWLSMEVSAPAATYNPNAGGGAGSVQIYDYTATIPIAAGATIRMKAFDSDCLMHRYCEGGVNKPCKGYVLPPISPADSPIDGSFLQMTVVSVTPM
jgi:hypothetical protein